MSFLLLDAEDSAVVQDAFDLIDSCDKEPIPSSLPTAASSDAAGVKRERSRERDFRRRQRQKEEKLQLQMQAQRMEMFLQQLRQSEDSAANASVSFASRASSCVTPEMQQQRVEAEMLNMSLRKAVAAEMKWAKSLRAVLDKRPSVETVSLDGSMLASSKSSLPSSSRVRCSPSAFQSDPAAIRQEISATMDRMYVEAKATVDPVTGAAAVPPSLGFHYNVQLTTKAGPVTELTSETPLNCSFESARELLTTMFSQPTQVQPTQPHLAVRRTQVKTTLDTGEVEKEFTVDLGGSRIKESLDGVGILRRHKDDDCEVVIWAAISFHQSGKISFREQSWMVAARAAPSATEESVIRINYRLNAQKAQGCNYINGEHIDQVRNHALGAIGTRMKTKHNMLQRKMLVETGRTDLASFLA